MNRRIIKASLLFVAIIAFAVIGCVKPSPGGSHLPPAEKYFNFTLIKEVKLNINYGAKGYKALVEIYAENPMEAVQKTRPVTGDDGSTSEETYYDLVKKENIIALFKAYTDNDSKLSTKINIPSYVSKVYVYTRSVGLPECVEVTISNNEISYVSSSVAALSSMGAASGFAGNGTPYFLLSKTGYLGMKAYTFSLYSLCQWGANGGNMTSNGGAYITNVASTSGGSSINGILNRVDKFLYHDNSEYKTSPDVTNIVIKDTDDKGNKVESLKLDLTFLSDRGMYQNTFGYIYYKTDAGLTDIQIRSRPQYVIFPNVNQDGREFNQNAVLIKEFTPPLKTGDKVRLKFFGEDGKGEPTDEFPAGYTVCWVLYPDAYNTNTNVFNNAFRTFYMISTEPKEYTSFVSLYDKTSNRLVLGVEDGPDFSFDDILFYVESDKMGAIIDPENPVIPGEPEIKEEVDTQIGTYAFEDIWPHGGDYDMNDVVVEYKREIHFKDQHVTKIVDTYSSVHNGATLENGFAYQIDANQVGTLSLPDGVIYEAETNSIRLYDNNKTVTNKDYVITRTFAQGALLKTDVKEYNPYIIVSCPTNSGKGRVEVHLPKHKATSLANQNLIGSGDDAYYIHKDGKYPFGINLPIHGYSVATEATRIDQEYPAFSLWVKSEGATNQDWYKTKAN